jgi:hypothetical protein
VAYADNSTPPAPTPNESDLVQHGQTVDKDGNVVHSPARAKTDKVPPGATAKCGDGTYSFTQSQSADACAHHGGVSNWLKG